MYNKSLPLISIMWCFIYITGLPCLFFIFPPFPKSNIIWRYHSIFTLPLKKIHPVKRRWGDDKPIYKSQHGLSAASMLLSLFFIASSHVHIIDLVSKKCHLIFIFPLIDYINFFKFCFPFRIFWMATYTLFTFSF